ncbi:hypothetical protein [Niastella koreensis]|uniref:hypothetical protein n=1 Tax=Niastella koreensis TaxID=354356 RepID=UPI001055DB72|nr:hypothetical protein [Niastella koreensis]
MHRALDLDSMRMSEEMGLEERMGESLNLGDNEDGGWEIYVFAKKQGEIYRIYWIGTQKNVWVSKTFYYENGMLVCGEMTVLRQEPHHNTEYTVKEYYWKNKRLAKITRNKFPVIEDRSFIPVSLLKLGKKIYDLNNSKT